jgi:ADP-ribose pyrophosphatase YjhB (NUDIX family)
MYDSDRFFQACAVPYRRNNDQIEFCLITSKKTQKWSLPKGTIRTEDNAVSDTVLRQALKEAGLHGETMDKPLGSYEYRKWEELLEVVVLLMHVTQCDDEWPDMDVRKRCWVDKDEALKLLAKDEHKKLVRAAWERICEA